MKLTLLCLYYLLATRNVEDFRGTPVKLLNPWS